jgi:hypothetical protein
VDTYSQPLLDALDHLCHQVDGDPEIEQEFYDANTPEEMVNLAVETGILIDADDFRALLRSGSTECWVVRGDSSNNPIVHLQRVLGSEFRQWSAPLTLPTFELNLCFMA